MALTKKQQAIAERNIRKIRRAAASGGYPKGTRFAVRRPGCTAWAKDLTFRQAVREQTRADRTIARGHQIVAHLPDGRTEVV